MKKINLCIIGIGYWGPIIIKTILNNKDIKIKYIIDKSPKVLRSFKKKIKVNCEYHTSISKINLNNIDAAIIATPVKTHFNLCKFFLKNKIHVFVEKPITLKVSQLKVLKKISENHKKIIMSGDLYLYHPAIIKIKNLIDKNYFGKIQYIYMQRLNFGKIRSDVNVIGNLITHDLSILLYWFKNLKIIKFNKSTKSFNQKKIDDIAFINLFFDKNIFANISLSWIHPEKVRKILIIGSKKMMIFDDNIPNKINIINKNIKYKKLEKNKFIYNSKKNQIITVDKSQPLANEMKHFVNCIKNNLTPKTGSSINLKVIKILEKILK
ncbi:Gfo/Idh/MocA family oxidoreductase [Candidatus Pelagibacter sp.]|nr:Gfo/Idh/MocA family oxidoreductase [Candidatus Pelagibacter sp.]